jgi:hypothetical protein
MDAPVSSSSRLCVLLHDKLREAIDRFRHLLHRVPRDRFDWRPRIGDGATAAAFSIPELSGHLIDCLTGFCAVAYARHPDRLRHFDQVRARVTAPFEPASVDEALARLAECETHVNEAFAALSDDDLAATLPTVFVPEGEAMLTLLLSNLEHVGNHKYQLFFYLKLMGVPVTSRDLYCFREAEVPEHAPRHA